MKKKIINTVCFWLIVLLLFQSVSNVLIPTWNDEAGMPIKRTNDFYQQEKDTMDAMIFGSSYSYYSVSPIPIWDNYGITAYSFGNPSQRIWTTYYYMEEAFKYQSPKVVFFEMGNADVTDMAGEGHNRQNLDTLPFSWTKLKAIYEVTSRCTETMASYLLPGLRYHSRWKEVMEDDFTRSEDTEYYGRGSLARFGAKPVSSSNLKKWMKDTGEELDFPEENEVYIDKMIELCEKNGAELVFVRFPEITWTKNKHDMIADLAEEKGIPFLDFNAFPEEYGLDWETDTSDKGEHMNIVGSEKVSTYLGQYLKDTYGFEDKRTNPDYADWNENSEKFQQVYEKNEIANTLDLNEYLEKIPREYYTAVISFKGNATKKMSDETKEMLRAMGMEEEALTKKATSYIGILDGGELVYQETEKVLLNWKDKVGDIKVDVTSAGTSVGNISIIKIDEVDYSANSSGINIVVYDKELNRVVDSVGFNTTRTNYSVSRRLQKTTTDEY